MSTLPLLISAVVALGRYNYEDSTAETRALDPRSIVQAVLVPQQFSTFGLRNRQKPARRTVVPMLFLRVACGLVVLATMMPGEDVHCRAGSYSCFCRYHREYHRAHRQSKPAFNWAFDGVNRSCLDPPTVYRQVEVVNSFEFVQLEDHYATGLCDLEMFAANIENISFFTKEDIWIYTSRNCSLYNDLPDMLREPCQLGAVDIVRLRKCRDGWPAFFSGVCDGRFTTCAAFTDPMTPEKLRVVIYIVLPMCALCALLVVHTLAQILKCSLMDVEENRTLRKQVNQKTRVYLEQLQNGHLEYSVLIGRVMLSGKVAFFLLDVIMDIVCVSTLFLSGSWQFASCQLLVLMISMCLQVRQTREDI
eukprot:symbB.v1.2.033466.t1/scaffold4158.1/size77177/3